jgi:chromosome segregation ATPase
MPEEEKKEPQEPEKPAGNPAAAPETNSASTAEDLAAITAQLEEEKKAKAAMVDAMAERATYIAQLEAELSEAKKGSEAATAELTQVKEAHTKAVSKYLDAVKVANPALPPDAITGGTIEEIDASAAKALSIAESVKKTLEAQAKEARVPAGAPARGEVSLEGLSPREKIAAGITSSRGTQ